MTEKIAIKELQSLEEESGLVILYEIALDEDGSSRAYFTRGEDTDLTNIQMYDYDNNSQLNTYDAIPVEAEGFDPSKYRVYADYISNYSYKNGKQAVESVNMSLKDKTYLTYRDEWQEKHGSSWKGEPQPWMDE